MHNNNNLSSKHTILFPEKEWQECREHQRGFGHTLVKSGSGGCFLLHSLLIVKASPPNSTFPIYQYLDDMHDKSGSI